MKHPAVYLIGAGPGDPGLITVHGLTHLRAADVVVYDDLVPARLLKHARQGAELINVGIASPQSTGQDAIGYLLVEKAREGKLVARLKFGDPFVFESGGAEALFLHEHGVPFEVVPGLAAGLAVPAYAGVPVTYPGGGDTITLVRGYEDESRTPPKIDWASLARLEGTVVCYAGTHQLPQLLENLISNGWPANAQAAIIYDGTLPSQETMTGTMQELLVQLREHSRRRQPAILVAGRVAGLREHLRWYDSRLLFGKRVLVTRPREQAAELVDRLTALGAESIEAPMIRMAPPDDPDPLLRAAASPEDFDWIIFTSANAVEAFMTALLDGERDIRALKGPRLCTSGTATADKLATYGIKVDLIPREFRADAVVPSLLALGPMAGVRVLLPRADIGREVIGEQLRDAGAVVTEVIAYRTILEDAQREGDPDIYRMLLDGRIDVSTFTSPSAIRNFAKIHGADQVADLLKNTVVATIGPVTADAARQLGIPVTIQPRTYTIPALVDAIAAYYAPKGSGLKVRGA
ncbi:MAG TPA: uroporphyrinogen-III C-methyltransferase [Vicinamibacterales bacterium]